MFWVQGEPPESDLSQVLGVQVSNFWEDAGQGKAISP